MRDFIGELQKKPYETRIKILWGVTIGFGIILIALWSLNIKSTIKNSSGQPLIPISENTNLPDQDESNFITVERVEISSSALRIYFNLNNQTDDILNVSRLAGIELTTDQGTIRPTQIQDRQNQTFVQKVLSHTQNFGVLVFPSINADKGSLTFNGMFLEKNPDQILKQTLELDFSKLNQDSKIRH
jgi:hypothetical protein